MQKKTFLIFPEKIFYFSKRTYYNMPCKSVVTDLPPNKLIIFPLIIL